MSKKLLEEEFLTLRDLPCETKDGHRMSLFVNTGFIGRYRTVS